MRKQTYGRKANAHTSSSTAKCFFAGSSSGVNTPVRPHNVASTLKTGSPIFRSPGRSVATTGDGKLDAPSDSPVSNTRSRAQLRLTEESLSGKDDVVGGCFEGLVSEFGQMGLGERPLLLKLDDCDESAVLRPRDINSLGTNSYFGRERKSDKQTQEELAAREQPDLNKLTKRLEGLESPTTVHDPPREQRKARSAQAGTTARTLRKKKNDSKAQTASAYAAYCRPLLDLCSDPKGRKAPTPFQDWADDLAQYFTVEKIAEASYGEVYRLSLREASQLTTLNPRNNRRTKRTLGKADESVLKIIPLKSLPSPTPSQSAAAQPVESIDEQNKSAIADVASEVRLLQHLSPIPGFTNFREIRVVQGGVPKLFAAAWRAYNKGVKKSCFPDPGLKKSYPESQLWGVVEMQDAGVDVEALVERASSSEFNAAAVRGKAKKGRATNKEENKGDRYEGISVWTAWDVFWGVALAVAKGEEWAGFEHRDLHMGNICVRSGKGEQDSILNPAASIIDTSRTIGYTGLETTLIDYTLSRAEVTSSEDVAFFDLSKDPAIFQGDASVDYQYEMYRAMRSAVVHDGDPCRWQLADDKLASNDQEICNANVWRQRHPVTNVVWLHFVLFKLMQRMPPVDYDEDVMGRKDLQSLGQELLQRLSQLEKILSLRTLATSEIHSAAELVQWAIEVGWLAEQDAIAIHGSEL